MYNSVTACQQSCFCDIFYFYAPASIDRGHIVFGLLFCLSVHLFVCKNFYTGHVFWFVRVKVFIFHTSIPCDKTFLLVPSRKSSVKVEYQGHNFQKMTVAGALVFHKHILFFLQLLPVPIFLNCIPSSKKDILELKALANGNSNVAEMFLCLFPRCFNPWPHNHNL